jgi:CDP-glucose 4,6-dehydratase
VLEPIRGYLMLGERCWFDAAAASAFNFGPREDDAISVFELTQRMLATWGEGSIEVRPPANAPHEARLLRLDYSKATRALGWSPLLRLEEAIQTTVTWYRTAILDPSAVADLTARQIRTFRDLALLAGAARIRHPSAAGAVPVAAGETR